MVLQELINLILADEPVLNEPALCRLLEQNGFADGRAAARSLLRLCANAQQRDAFAAFAPHLFAALSGAGDPDRVLATFERFMQNARRGAPGGSEPDLNMFRFLAARPRAVEMLARLFSGSQFLAEILLRNPEYIERLIDHRRLAKVRSRERFIADARAAIAGYAAAVDQLDALRRFQRWELLRIGACDLLDLFDMPAATLQLSHLADSLVQVCLEVAGTASGALTPLDAADAASRVSPPLGISTRGFAVIGMGKLGGQELNYSSDIDFLFLAGAVSPEITRVGERLIDGLARVTTEGFLYRVDMRLRPWGRVGPLVSSVEGYLAYLKKHALLWEKQALLKARLVAGDPAVGEDFLQQVRPLLFDEPVESMRADVFAMKQRTEAFAQQRGRGGNDVKLGEGSIRDVEFVVQFLQLSHGAQSAEARGEDFLSPNTLEGLARCQKAGLLSVSEYRVLSTGYIFLRTVEHHLQMMDYRQTHTLPADAGAIASLARRLGFEGESAGEKFMQRYHQHALAIRGLYLRYVGRLEMKKTDRSHLRANPAAPTEDPPAGGTVDTHRARMNPSYTEQFSDEEIARHAQLAAQLNPEHLAVVDGKELAGVGQESGRGRSPDLAGDGGGVRFSRRAVLDLRVDGGVRPGYPYRRGVYLRAAFGRQRWRAQDCGRVYRAPGAGRQSLAGNLAAVCPGSGRAAAHDAGRSAP